MTVDINEFLKYAQPDVVLSAYAPTDNAWHNKHMADIVDGVVTTTTDYEEHYYGGGQYVSELINWLEPFAHSGWKLGTGYDGDIYIYKETERPLTAEEIKEATDYIAKHGREEAKYIKWRTPKTIEEHLKESDDG